MILHQVPTKICGYAYIQGTFRRRQHTQIGAFALHLPGISRIARRCKVDMQIRTVGDIQMIQVNQVLSVGGPANRHIARAVIIGKTYPRVGFIDKLTGCQYHWTCRHRCWRDSCCALRSRCTGSGWSVSERIRLVACIMEEQWGEEPPRNTPSSYQDEQACNEKKSSYWSSSA